jgi:hypothetical protein
MVCRRAHAAGAQQQLASSPLTSPFPGATPTHLQMQQHSSLGGGSHGHLFAGSSTAPTSVASSEAGDWEPHDHTLRHHHGGGCSASSGLGSSGLLNHGQGLDAGQGFAGSSSSEAGAGPSSPQHHPRLPPINTSLSPVPGPAVDVASSSSSLGGAFVNAAAAAGAGSSSMRLGLKLEQRSDVRRLVDVLSRRVRQAAEDLGAAVAEVCVLLGCPGFMICSDASARCQLLAAPVDCVGQHRPYYVASCAKLV